MYGTDPIRDTADRLAKQQAEIGNASTTPARETLRNRMARGVDRIHRDRDCANKMEELVYLLDKNPEVARILDLFDEVGHS